MKCEYGCNRESKYQLKNGKWCCENSCNKCISIRQKNREAFLKRAKRPTWANSIKKLKCQFCYKTISNIHIKKHELLCKLNPENVKILEEKRHILNHICENCNINHNGLFGSGRFCSKKCAISFSHKNEISWVKHFKCTMCNADIIKAKRANVGNIILCDNCKMVKCKACDAIIKSNTKYGLCRICLSKSKEYKEKLSVACTCNGGYRDKGGRGKYGWYKGYWCQSSWELAWVIYNLEHNIQFKRNTKGFTYEYDNTYHKFYPDFIMQDGTYIEIKGYMTKQAEEKIKQFVGILKVVGKIEIIPFMQYTINKYGKDFIKLYE